MPINFIILHVDNKTETENGADRTIMELCSYFTIWLTNKNRLNQCNKHL